MTLECQSNCLKSNKKQQSPRVKGRSLKSIKNPLEMKHFMWSVIKKIDRSIVLIVIEAKGQFYGQVGWVTSG